MASTAIEILATDQLLEARQRRVRRDRRRVSTLTRDGDDAE